MGKTYVAVLQQMHKSQRLNKIYSYRCDFSKKLLLDIFVFT